MSKPLSWVARRRGNIYCSPACGCGCSIQMYRQAVKSANTLAHRLGSGWKPDVWENLGWYYCVVSPCRSIKVYQNQNHQAPAYTAYLDGNNFAASGSTPQIAVHFVIEKGRERLRLLAKTITGLQSIHEEMKPKRKSK